MFTRRLRTACALILPFFLLATFSVASAATVTIINLDAAGTGLNDPTAATPVGGNTGTTKGGQALIVFEEAASIWGGILGSPVEIKVGSSFAALSCSATSGVLGSAGPQTAHRDFANAPLASTWYPQALANSLAGADLDAATNDIGMQFNGSMGTPGCLESLSWYMGLDAVEPANTISLLSVALHEIGHGLGFASFVSLSTGTLFNSLPDGYSSNLEDHSTGLLYPAMSNAQRVSASTNTGNLHWTGALVVAGSGVLSSGAHASGHVEMYAPNPAQQGSSVSHFSTSLTPNELMEPSHTGPDLDPGLAVPLLQDMGWALATGCGDGVLDVGEDCDGGDCCSSSCTFETAGSTCTDDGDACTTDTCDGAGTCDHPAAADGSACDDGVACTTGETCQAGACVSSTPACDDGESCTVDTCEVSNCFSTGHGAGCNDPVCEAAVCALDSFCCTNTWDGLCVDGGGGSTGSADLCAGRENFCGNAGSPDGTLCDDGDPATGGDVCTGGVCAGTGDLCAGVTCSASDQCHAVGTCDPGTGLCSDPALANGTACDDSDACSQTDTCQAGTCTGSNPVVCSASDQCHTTGTCDPGTGVCSNPNAADGTSCNDGQFCNAGETCSSGVCGGGAATDCSGSADQCNTGSCNETTDACEAAPVANGTTCDDAAFCTTDETCTAGTCGGGAATDCSDSADQCNAGSCNETSNSCEGVSSNEGGGCDDGNPTTSNDVCTAGTCSGTNLCSGVTCTASDQCHTVGTCDPNTGLCSDPPAAAGSPCGDSGTECVVQDTCDGVGSCTDNGFVAVDTNCGAAATECSAQDSCNGAGACQANDLAMVVTCGDAGTECTNQDFCDGAGACTDNGFVADGDDCGSAASECSAQDSCDGAGACQANDLAILVTCGDTGSECTNQDFCDGAGACTDNGFVAVDTNCGSAASECSAQDSCDGAGSCEANDAAAATDCGDAGTECTNQDACDGNGACTDNGFVAAASACGDAGDTECTNPDTCNGSGTCQANDINEGGSCADALFCNGAELCQSGACVNGAAPDCGDGVGCTTDSCNEGTDTCDNTPVDAACDNGQFCDGSETCSAALDCQSGSDPCPGQSCDESGDQCLTGPVAMMEAGTVPVGGSPVTVLLENLYSSPVVACTVQYDNNTTPVVTRVSAVGSSSFQVRLQNPSGGAVATDNVNCLVVEEGTWTIDGVNIEAQAYLSTVTDRKSSWSGQAQSYGQAYTNPVVIGQVMTENDANWSYFWARGSSRQSPPSATTLNTGKGVGEDTNTTRANETVGFIVFEAGHGTIGGVEFEAGLGTDTVRGVDNGPPFAYNYSAPFATVPTVAVASQAAVDGNDGGWVQTFGAAPSSASQLFLSIDEDQISNGERSHTTEQVGYAVFAGPVVYPLAPSCTEGQACDDGNACTTGDTCTGGVCAGSATDCSGLDDQCSTGVCNAGTGNCEAQAANEGGSCDDGLFCNAGETCAAGSCAGGGAVDCSAEGDQCNTGTCNESTDACQAVASNEGGSCDDGAFCNEGETCTAGSCSGGGATDCSGSGDQCNTGSCNETSNTCEAVASNEGGGCDDSNACTQSDTCQAGECTGTDPVTCTASDQCHDAGVCDTGTGECSDPNKTDDTSCSDGDACTQTDTCQAGACTGADPVTCTASDQCHVAGVCDTGTGECSDPNKTDGSACDDGAFCNEGETCTAGSCSGGGATDCSDSGDQCNTGSCNEATNACEAAASNEGSACNDGDACTTGETCTGGACEGTPTDCSAQDDQCNTGVCNAGTGACEAQPANEGGSCDDGLFCNAGETCAAGNCAGGGATDCSDGVGCTTDSCNEGTDSCDSTPVDAACVNGQFCDGTETCSATLDCQSGADPCPGQGCNEATDQCLAGPVAMMEAGTVAVGGSPVTVVLVNSYTSPVVACTVQYNNNTTPVVTRVSAVGSSSFQVRLQNPSDGAVATDDVNCLVVEEGTWTIDGVNIEAQTYLSTLTDRRGNWNGQSQSYGQAYTNPVVIGQVMTENDANWSHFWSNGGSRQTPPSAATLNTGKAVGEDGVTSRADETVGFIVIEAGHGTIGGVEFEAALGADTVRGTGNSPPYSYSYSTPFSAAPTVAVASQSAMDGNDGSWVQAHGATLSNATTLFLSVDEDQVGGSERRHTHEQVSYAVFAGPVVYP